MVGPVEPKLVGPGRHHRIRELIHVGGDVVGIPMPDTQVVGEHVLGAHTPIESVVLGAVANTGAARCRHLRDNGWRVDGSRTDIEAEGDRTREHQETKVVHG